MLVPARNRVKFYHNAWYAPWTRRSACRTYGPTMRFESLPRPTYLRGRFQAGS